MSVSDDYTVFVAKGRVTGIVLFLTGIAQIVPIAVVFAIQIGLHHDLIPRLIVDAIIGNRLVLELVDLDRFGFLFQTAADLFLIRLIYLLGGTEFNVKRVF